ncbi:glutathione S-transferase [Pandoraea apista]|uniref:glutathione S-transferase n=1 Tax=Pandoraea apista TaxID=93218 RepID=UPI00058AA38A|nr:glutathione S-transferase [Pandoraea apista]AJE98366.1 glutathione S-transferase [Pandoraea apista]AKH72421.1 glutathione S-transferase [Pandoraea apista]AKI60811.1 glutathione S-transferase [Pandoraea apista]
MTFELFYWPGLQGRGEFVRLAFEATGTPYVEIVQGKRPGQGMDGLLHTMDNPACPDPPYAPPFLRVGDELIGQTANILAYLGPRLGLVGESPRARRWVNQLQLTLADLVAEVHDGHHPIASRLYYSNQRAEARKRTADLIDYRLPKFFGYFERVLANNPHAGGWLSEGAMSYADLSLFQVIEGLHYAFPRAMSGFAKAFPRSQAVHDAVARQPHIAAYLKSSRRIAFNTTGIFRHYKELDRASPF